MIKNILIVVLLLGFIILFFQLDQKKQDLATEKRLRENIQEEAGHWKDSLSVTTVTLQVVCEQVDCNDLIEKANAKYPDGNYPNPKKMRIEAEYK